MVKERSMQGIPAPDPDMPSSHGTDPGLAPEPEVRRPCPGTGGRKLRTAGPAAALVPPAPAPLAAVGVVRPGRRSAGAGGAPRPSRRTSASLSPAASVLPAAGPSSPCRRGPAPGEGGSGNPGFLGRARRVAPGETAGGPSSRAGSSRAQAGQRTATPPPWHWLPLLVACLVAALAGWGVGKVWTEGVAISNPSGAGVPEGTPDLRPGHAAAGAGPLGLQAQTVLAAEPRVHVVQKGETLYRIARRYGVPVEELARYNGLTDPARIEAGQRLRIPGAAGFTAAGQAPDAGPGAASGPGTAASRDPGAAPGSNSPGSGRPGTGPGGASGPGTGEGGVRAGGEDPSGSTKETRLGGGGNAAEGGLVALTFNDGPDPVTWPALLAVLEEHDVKATFFLEGARSQQHPQLVQELARRGHQVENHGWSHRSPHELGEAATRAEIRRTAALLARLAGRPPLYYRPAGDLRDPAVFRWAREEGHRVLLWTNIGAQDVPPLPPDQLAARVAASAYNGAVLMLHATQRATIEALPLLLQRLDARALRPVTVDQLLDALQAATPQGEAAPATGPGAAGDAAGPVSTPPSTGGSG
ncbi:putative xylanase/chitin deacetylase [Thermaerobacter subterraneus DSM 13965]|uniref:Xylanase/chitin deacetylase n=1 Tax=Thermaerobacter subterraneus DSM 13965 TaxID=867903 RepID=K6PZA2_9FIRM|nr:putative xylanase/chitin deacetylase [Thermaerobacter subterraneus DSM 13965]